VPNGVKAIPVKRERPKRHLSGKALGAIAQGLGQPWARGMDALQKVAIEAQYFAGHCQHTRKNVGENGGGNAKF